MPPLGIPLADLPTFEERHKVVPVILEEGELEVLSHCRLQRGKQGARVRTDRLYCACLRLQCLARTNALNTVAEGQRSKAVCKRLLLAFALPDKRVRAAKPGVAEVGPLAISDCSK